MADQFIGQVLADKYRIDSIIRDGYGGGGGNSSSFGRLYRGAHIQLGKPVAVKILPPPLALDDQNVERFSSEVSTLSRLSHPNIPSVTDFGQDKNGAIFIVTEQGAGETLKNAVRREGQFPLERANRVTQQIASALSAAHANGVVHENLSSENVFLSTAADGADFVKVLDFGAPRTQENGADTADAKRFEYLAPELTSGAAAPAAETEADARSDVYSLGVILYEMLAGEVPFAGDDAAEIALKHAQEPPPPLAAFRADLPGEIEQIVLRALAKIPENRYRNANELADALNRATVFATRFAPDGQAIPAAAMMTADTDRPQNNLWKTAFIVLAGIAILSGFFIYMTQVKQTNPATTLQTDANGNPVQPVNPPTGAAEQSLSNMGAYNPVFDANTNTYIQQPPMSQQQVMPGGDNYDPWARGGQPPPGAPAPQYVPPTGQYYDGNINPTSPFMAPDGNIYVAVPKGNANVNANAAAAKPKTSPTPAGAANTQTAPPANTKPSVATPAANTSAPTQNSPKQTVPPAKTPSKPADSTPKNDKPAPSGKVQES